MFAKFHNTLQDSSYESRKKERKKKREKLPTKSPIDYSDLTTRCNWYSLPRHEDNAHFPTATLPTLPFTTKLQARYSWLRGRKNRPRESVVQSGKRSIPIDHAVLIERSRPRVHAKSNRHIQSRRFIHWKPIPADWYLRQWTRLVSHFQGRRVSLSLSRLDLSLLSRFWLAFALIIANPKTPMREILPRRTISSLHDLRGILVIRSHTFLGGSLLCWLLVNRVESRPALGSLILMVRWLGRQRVAPGLGVVPR